MYKSAAGKLSELIRLITSRCHLLVMPPFVSLLASTIRPPAFEHVLPAVRH